MNEFGWKVIDNSLVIDWKDPRNLEQVKESVRLLLHGCGCKKKAVTPKDVHALKLV